jgi:hypothetical protein
MRIRTIKPEFWHSPHQAELDWPHKVLFLGLLNLADDQGRALGDPRYVKGQLLPYEEITPDEVADLLDHLHRVGLIELYNHSGRRHLAIVNFSKHQSIDRPKASKLPDPKDPASSVVDDSSTINRRHVDDESTTNRRAVDDRSLLEQGTGNREQGTENTPSNLDEELDLDDAELDLDDEEIADIVELDAKKPIAGTKDRTQYSIEFVRFWDLYPRRIGKGDAWKAWKALKPAERQSVLEGLHRHLDHWDRIEIPTQFIPHPGTWLRQNRWEDDIETDTRETESSHPSGWNALQRIAGQLEAKKEIGR